MHIYYDGTRPDMVLYNGATYRYVHSLQGDILGLQNGTGAFVVEYRYDAWGRPTSKTGPKASSLGTINPFRYRSYVLDEDVGLYYLRSRYYNPWWGRFISTDAVLGQIGGLLQHNLFAYCYNAPVVHFDDDGEWINALATVVTAVVVATAVVAASPVIATAAGTTAICLGVASWATTASTIATVGCATVSTATIECGVNRGVETITEKNYGVILMGPNAYGFFETAIYMSGAAICMAPNYVPYPSTGRTVPKDLQEQMKYPPF